MHVKIRGGRGCLLQEEPPSSVFQSESTILNIIASSYVIETLWVSKIQCAIEDFWNCNTFSSLHFKESVLTRKIFFSECV